MAPESAKQAKAAVKVQSVWAVLCVTPDMSAEDADQHRAKRRRCAPKRFDDEVDALTGKVNVIKHSPADKSKQRRQPVDHVDPSPWSHMHTAKARHAAQGPRDSEDDKALHIIKQLAARLQSQHRPHLGALFGLLNEDFMSASIRYQTLYELCLISYRMLPPICQWLGGM